MTDSWTTGASDVDEKAVLLGFLSAQQAALRRKLDGLTEADARHSPVASRTNLAGLLKHATYVHARWFELCFADAVPDGRLPWPTNDHIAETDETLETLRARYDETIRIAAGIVADANLEDLNRGWHGGGYEPGTYTLRWILLHMIEELARHCGHADIIREVVDGTTGYP